MDKAVLNRNSSKYRLLSAAFFACLVLLGGYLYIRSRSLAYNKPDLLYSVHINGPKSARQSLDRREGYITKAKLLREKWLLWLSEHPDFLQQMASAQASDKATALRLYNKIPSRPSEVGFKKGDLGTSSPEDIDKPDNYAFTWNAFKPKRRQTFQDPNTQSRYDKAQKQLLSKLQNDFAEHRDIALADSLSFGRSRITLWASGRITETTVKSQRVPGQPGYVEMNPVEIMPAVTQLER